MGFAKGDLDRWYKLSNKELIQNGAQGLLRRYGGSISLMVATVFPEKEWQLWRFETLSRKLFASDELLLQAVRAVETSLNIKSPNDWYKISLDQLRDHDAERIFTRRGGLVETLKRVYPKVYWNEALLLGKGYKRSSQHLLGVILREIFPNLEIISEYSHPTLTYENTKQPMRFDFYLPQLNLAFEYQGEQHYDSDVTIFGNSEKRQSMDRLKSSELERGGMTLVSVPFWWGRSRDKLLELILASRPDLGAIIKQ